MATVTSIQAIINAGGWLTGFYFWEIWRDDQKLCCGKWVKN